MLADGYRPYVNTMHVFPYALLSVWIVDRGARGRLPRLFNSRVLEFLGLTMYTGYVVHRYVMHFLGFDYQRGLHVFIPVLLISYAIAIASWFCFERPINNLRRYWPYVPRPKLAVADAVVAPPGVMSTMAERRTTGQV
jgi:peptidoglycan/LPS O-acetylase OafA/YrhL